MLTELRRELHRRPELSGQEERTAARIAAFLRQTAPDRIIAGLGGHGVAAVYDSGKPGPRILLRCEPDGLSIEDLADVPHRSAVAGRGHQCGHDGDERADLRRNPGPDRDKAVQPLNDTG